MNALNSGSLWPPPGHGLRKPQSPLLLGRGVHPMAGSAKEADFECPLCLKLLFEPCTMRCGHSFCRACCSSLIEHQQKLGSSAKCPTCRRVLPVHAKTDLLTVSFTLSRLLETVFPESYTERAAEAAAEAAEAKASDPSEDDGDLPLAGRSSTADDVLPLFFLDSLLPRQHMRLNVFEIRYRLLVRRVLESNRKFGMVGFGNAGSSLVDQRRLGTEVEITECVPQRDGRFHLEVVGRRTFEMHETWDEDGYSVANVTWLDPRPLPEPGAEPQTEPEPEAEAEAPSRSTVLATSHRLEELVGEWENLVHVGGWERYRGQLAHLRGDLGAMPSADNAIDRALWVGALINPLPPLGVAPEIRPALLLAVAEASDEQNQLTGAVAAIKVVTKGLEESIEYLTPSATRKRILATVRSVTGAARAVGAWVYTPATGGEGEGGDNATARWRLFVVGACITGFVALLAAGASGFAWTELEKQQENTTASAPLEGASP
eukprot:COSAG05_NODE_1437_length_4887_cov_5.343150_3_plen_489_part_00